MQGTLYSPELLWSGGGFRSGTLAVAADGRIVDAQALPRDAKRVTLPRRALLPGLVNAHSHAFQRVLRGRTELTHPQRPEDDFWSWRERMYAAATRLDPEALYLAARQAFVEMALAGITTVGEFHYLHHQPDGTPYAERELLAKTVVRAARDVGLRVVLLRVGYARAGFERPEDPRQRRFCDSSPDAWLSSTEALASELAGDPAVSVGLAPHSVRALPRPWLEALARASTPRRVHMHVAEQPAEVDACVAEHGKRPVALLHALGLLSPKLTAVHGIHLRKEEVALLGEAGAGVCACPSTERNLGDGIVPADLLLHAGARLSLGSDSQASIDLLDEARQLEGHLRLLRGRRNVLTPPDGDPQALAEVLLRIATADGAQALGVNAGDLIPGRAADFVTVDLDHPSLAGAEGRTLLPALFTGGSPAVIRDVAVDGRFVVRDGVHRLAEESGRAFSAMVKELFA